MSFCSKCGANVPEGSRFCPVCGAPAEPAASVPSAASPGYVPSAQRPSGPAAGYGSPAGHAGYEAPRAGAYGQPAPGASPASYGAGARAHRGGVVGPVVAGYSLWTLIVAGVLVLALIFLFQAWLSVPVGSIYAAMGSSLPSGLPASVDASVASVSTLVSMLRLYFSMMFGNGSSFDGGMFVFASVVWALAVVLSAVAVTVLFCTKGQEERPALVAGIVNLVLSLVWVIGVNGANAAVMNQVRAYIGSYSGSVAAALANLNVLVVTPFVWLTLVCGLVAVVVVVLKMVRVIR